jgi:hypothetical protein
VDWSSNGFNGRASFGIVELRMSSHHTVAEIGPRVGMVTETGPKIGRLRELVAARTD